MTVYTYHTFKHAFIVDDPHTEPLTEAQRQQCLKWWDEQLERSMRRVLEGMPDGR